MTVGANEITLGNLGQDALTVRRLHPTDVADLVPPHMIPIHAKRQERSFTVGTWPVLEIVDENRVVQNSLTYPVCDLDSVAGVVILVIDGTARVVGDVVRRTLWCSVPRLDPFTLTEQTPRASTVGTTFILDEIVEVFGVFADGAGFHHESTNTLTVPDPG
jgi:hypothetical protein